MTGWADALGFEHSWTDGFDLRSFVEDPEHELAVCVWRAPDRDQLEQSLDATFGHAAVNEIHAVTVHLKRDSKAVDPDD